MKLLQLKPINTVERRNKANPDLPPKVENRVWLEGHRLGLVTSPGAPYTITENAAKGEILLDFTCDAGEFTVSKRKTARGLVPLIEISEMRCPTLKDVPEGSNIRIFHSEKGILIRLNVDGIAQKQKEREERLLHKLQNGLPLEKGSVFAGGGTKDFCGDKGFKRAGLASVIRVAIDFDANAVENLAQNCPHLFDERSMLIEGDLAALNFDSELKLDYASITPSCTDASIAGKSKKGLKGESEQTAHLVYFYTRFVEQTNPAIIMMENVRGFANEASFHVFCAVMRHMGYNMQRRDINANAEGFSLEGRERMYVMFTSAGLGQVLDLNDIVPLWTPAQNVADILDDVPLDHRSWGNKSYLFEKEKRDAAKGNSFAMQIYRGPESKLSTLRAQYHKGGSSDPLYAHPTEPDTYRLFNQFEQCRAKEIDPALVDNVPFTGATQILGNGLIGHISESWYYHLALQLKKIAVSPNARIAA
ncbi:DNA cytosine methyltransferase [Ferrimonas marina]|uniref:DNA (Cytosine-5)-methyltransferase 1 n=1 Tax=Ferrimonas marina TaxID=299255 RepID=A0A1M5TW32_9GAMM|nr:DNA cytosine methyltransferase [Ferrimonas marina]SHH55045.1 DNA (cytosine-5)-methyltransferase 1 [Ferrimonas marina]